MINKVILVGRLTEDIELRKTAQGLSTIAFSLAVNRPFKKEGEQQADFINCVAWRQQADFLSNYAHKGDLVGVEGRMQMRTYEGQNGKVYITEVVCDSVQILSKKETKEEPKEEPKQQHQTNLGGEYDLMGYKVKEVDIDSDALPFY